jgi:molybdopterin-guanine dinucleotide biosynthesis protein A
VDFDGIVLAGGGARRLGGTDKAALELGGTCLLDRTLNALQGATKVVVVGPRRPTTRSAVWTREEPAGAGPVAALAAGFGHTSAEVVAVLAVDLPLLGAPIVACLVTAVAGHDGALGLDDQGRPQPLAAAYRRDALRARLDALPRREGAPMHDLIERMSLARVEIGAAARDCDTWDDVAAARRALEGELDVG